jgi:WD40 repeat protein
VKKYDAFISYRHATDGAFAAEFELHLKRYGRSPLVQPRRIFRDEQHIRPGSDIGATINAALAAANHLVLLASPEAAESVWVQKELEYWCGTLGRADRLIIVITAGTVAPEPDGHGIDWSRTTALPKVLTRFIDTLPLWVDMTNYASKPSQRMDEPQYRAAINAIVAAFENVDPNDLNGKEWRIRRRNLQVAWGAVATTVGLLVISVAAGIALLASNADLSEALSISRSRELAARAVLQQLPDSLSTAVAAVETYPTREASVALLSEMANRSALRRQLSYEGEAVEALAETVDGTHLVFIPPNAPAESFGVIDLSTGDRRIYRIPGAGRLLAVNRTSDALYVLGETGVWQIDPTGHGATLHSKLDENELRNIAAVADTHVLAGTSNGLLLQHDVGKSTPRVVATAEGWVQDIVVQRDVVAVAFLAPERSVQVRLQSGAPWRIPPDLEKSVNALAVAPNGKYLAAAHETGWLSLWSLPDLELRWRVRLPTSGSAVAFKSGNDYVAVGTSAGEVLVFDLDYGDRQDAFQAVNGGVWVLRWLGENLVTAGSDGWIRLWQPMTPGPLTERLAPADLFSTEADELIAWSGTNVTRNADGIVSSTSHAFGDLAVAEGRVALGYNETIVTAFILGADNTVAEILFPDPPAETHRVHSVALSQDGALAAVNWWPRDFQTAAAQVAVWSPQTGKVLWLNSLPRVPKVLTLSPEGKVAIGSSTGTLSLHDPTTGDLLHGGPLKADPGPLTKLLFDGEGRICAGALLGRALCATLGETIQPVARTDLPVGSVRDLDILPNGDVIVVDIDAVRWFDHSLQYRGPLVTTGNGARSVDDVTVDPTGNRLTLVLRGGMAAMVPLNLSSWTKEAKRRVALPPRIIKGGQTN